MSESIRKQINYSNLVNKYDLVMGPIANDDLDFLFRQFSNGLIDVDTIEIQCKSADRTG